MSWLKRLLLGSDDDKQDTATNGPTSVADADYTTTDSGLQYYDIKPGTGESPTPGKEVTVHYTGWLTNGKQFDSSVSRNHPFSFAIGKRQVIKGWDEGVLSMKVGGVRQLKLPPELGYGAAGSPPVIPQNATLIFEIELLGVG